MKYAFANHIFSWPPHQRCAAPPPPDDRRLQLRWIRAAGFDGVEMGDFWMDFYRMSEPALDLIRAEHEAAGLPIVALNCLRKAVTPPDCAARTQSDLRQALVVASRLGAQLINVSLAVPHELIGQTTDLNRGVASSVGGSRTASDDDYRLAASFLRDLADEAAARGLELSIELHHNSLTDTGASLARLLGLIDRSNVAGNPDLGNLVWAYDVPEETPAVALERSLQAGINFWHVKNIQRVYLPELSRSAFVHAALPEGDIDYRAAMIAVERHGFNGWISIEGAGPGDVMVFAQRGLAYLRQIEQELRDDRAQHPAAGAPRAHRD